MHRKSLANGLTAVHFAVYWPWALQQLIDAGADVDSEDELKRRPIHLAMACGQDEAVSILLKADCSLSTPNSMSSLLQESLRKGQMFEHTSSRLVHAIIDRHTRLINLALSVSLDSSSIKMQLSQRFINEKQTHELTNMLEGVGCHIPPSLAIDNGRVGVYDVAGDHPKERMTTTVADQLWEGGFRCVDEPYHRNMLTPILQSWQTANFDMVSWFIGKGASPYSQRLETLHSGLHLYAAKMSWVGWVLQCDPSKLQWRHDLFKQLVDDKDMWRDSCRCLCSPLGCTPISIAIKQWPPLTKPMSYGKALDLSKVLHGKLLYRPVEDPDHTQQLLEILVFERLNLKHSCCRIGLIGEARTRSPLELRGRRDWRGLVAEYSRRLAECTSKMLSCGCHTAEKPACVVFREECWNRH